MNDLDIFESLRPDTQPPTPSELAALRARVFGESAWDVGDLDTGEGGDVGDPAVTPPTRRRRPRRRLVGLVAASVVAVGVAGIWILERGPATDPAGPAQQLPTTDPNTATPPTIDHPIGPLLSTPVEFDASPLAVLTAPGWEMTGASATSEPSTPGAGFDGATVFVGDGPTFDAPLFVATVLDPATVLGDTTQGTVPTVESFLSDGDPIVVAGAAGVVNVIDVDPDSGLAGPILTVFWPLADGSVGRVNTVRLTLDDTIALADQLTLVDGALTMPVPAGYRQLNTQRAPVRQHFSYQFTNGDRHFEVLGENRGAASLLGRIAGEVRTTRIIDGTEIAYRPQPHTVGSYWADWLAGDWSYYVIADGFDSEDEFTGALSSLALTDPATFAAAGPTLGLVLPGRHDELAGHVLTDVPLTEAAFADAATTQLAMSADSYGFELFQGAVCTWTQTADNDPAATPSIVSQLEAAIARNAGTGFERAAQTIAQPALEALRGQQPQTDPSVECPAWATGT